MWLHITTNPVTYCRQFSLSATVYLPQGLNLNYLLQNHGFETVCREKGLLLEYLSPAMIYQCCKDPTGDVPQSNRVREPVKTEEGAFQPMDVQLRECGWLPYLQSSRSAW